MIRFTKLAKEFSINKMLSYLRERIRSGKKSAIKHSDVICTGVRHAKRQTLRLETLSIGNVLHYVRNGSALETDVGKTSFLGLLASARPTYAELANHSAYRQSCNYPASELIYAA